MELSASKAALLEKLNQQAVNDHQEASRKAELAGRRAPPPPVPLLPEEIEYPKWLHKGWVEVKGKPGCLAPTESKLVKNKAEHEAAGTGWSEAPSSESKAVDELTPVPLSKKKAVKKE